MNNLSHLTIKQLNNLKSIFISGTDWHEVSAIQYEIDTREKEFKIEEWMMAYLTVKLHLKNILKMTEEELKQEIDKIGDEYDVIWNDPKWYKDDYPFIDSGWSY